MDTEQRRIAVLRPCRLCGASCKSYREHCTCTLHTIKKLQQAQCSWISHCISFCPFERLLYLQQLHRLPSARQCHDASGMSTVKVGFRRAVMKSVSLDASAFPGCNCAGRLVVPASRCSASTTRPADSCRSELRRQGDPHQLDGSGEIDQGLGRGSQVLFPHALPAGKAPVQPSRTSSSLRSPAAARAQISRRDRTTGIFRCA